MPDPPPHAPRKRATALTYQDGVNRAPVIAATGAGLIAERIIEEARASGVPVRRDPALAQALSALDLGDEVSPALYAAVAEALAWAYRIDAQARARG
jgi:flagellar biosynthesis protein